MNIRRDFTAISLALVLAFALGTLTARAAWDDEQGYDPSLGLARISYMTGDVLFFAPDTEEWAEASPNFALREQDSLWVGDESKAEVRFATGETAWLNYQSGLDLLQMKSNENGETYQVGLPYGEASFYVKNFDTLGSVFQVDTPSASVRAFGRALFRVSSLDDGTTQVGVRDGSVEVESEYGVLTLRPGDLMEVYPSGRPRVMELPREDSWDDWVEARLDRYTRKYASDRYLPREMDSYADEFDEYGSWVSYPEYGNVWVPRVAVGWSPYSYGRWVYVGYDYVWLPYDPWYAPYHYGRWYWDVGFGWFWIPPAVSVSFWSPGYVGWCYGPDYLYWVPLGPGEIYYGHGYYGPRSVNIYIHKEVNIKNVYINSRVKNSVVVVHRDDFREGRTRRVEIRDNDNPFRNKVRDVQVIGRSPVREIKVDRKLRVPKPDSRVTERAKPPKKVIERNKVVKERRVVTKSRGSAFDTKKKPERLTDVDTSGRKSVWKKQEERTTTTRDRDKVRETDTGRDRGKVRETDTGRDRDKVRETDTGRDRDKIRETETGTDRGTGRQPSMQKEDKGGNGRGEQGATRSNRWEQLKEDRPATTERTRSREEDKSRDTTGRGVSGRSATTESDTGPGRSGEKLYRDTGSDRGSLQRDKSKGSEDTGTGRGAVQPSVDDSGKSKRPAGWGTRDAYDEKGASKEPQPAVRTGPGKDDGAAAGQEKRPVKATERGTSKERTGTATERGTAKKRTGTGATEESGEDESGASEQSESPGRGLGRDSSGK